MKRKPLRHKYYYFRTQDYEALENELGDCVIRNINSNKFYFKKSLFISRMEKANGKQIQWSIKDTTILLLVVISVVILTYMLIKTIDFESKNISLVGSCIFFIINIIIHELGHNLALRLFGRNFTNYKFKMKGIFPSIVCKTNEAYLLSRFERFFVFYAGIFTNIIVCFIGYCFTGFKLIYPSLGFIIFNLLPIPVIETDGFNIVYYCIFDKKRIRSTEKSLLLKIFSSLVLVVIILVIYYISH